jgi:hypothetical protein
VKLRVAIFLLLALRGVSGCVSEPDPAADREDDILDYYMPRTTEYRYLYSYSGFSSGKHDSLFHVDYRGIAPLQNSTPTDGHTPIHQYTVSSTDGSQTVDIDLYVSDSAVIEYGRDCSVTDERFIPLTGKLRQGNGWRAAQNYKANADFRISFLANVVAHYDQIIIADSVLYKDVWQVNYTVTSSPTDPKIIVSKEFLNNARRVIYFARGIGKIYEIAYSPQNEKQWQNELLRVDRR